MASAESSSSNATPNPPSLPKHAQAPFLEAALVLSPQEDQHKSRLSDDDNFPISQGDRAVRFKILMNDDVDPDSRTAFHQKLLAINNLLGDNSHWENLVEAVRAAKRLLREAAVKESVDPRWPETCAELVKLLPSYLKYCSEQLLVAVYLVEAEEAADNESGMDDFNPPASECLAINKLYLDADTQVTGEAADRVRLMTAFLNTALYITEDESDDFIEFNFHNKKPNPNRDLAVIFKCTILSKADAVDADVANSFRRGMIKIGELIGLNADGPAKAQAIVAVRDGLIGAGGFKHILDGYPAYLKHCTSELDEIVEELEDQWVGTSSQESSSSAAATSAGDAEMEVVMDA
ncbi:hypothetical protein BDV96DRAFT_676509 [Lophiotrema nucula]|uniref:Uncharacterized protein n=1 Tax=Lophiotrema nucula TaxID=690887 RepID=A0A6A5ZK89_9PLEO|nr:hypothetical protein BDV96DRAFT_676509 [Lophiotrema nucula]